MYICVIENYVFKEIKKIPAVFCMMVGNIFIIIYLYILIA